MSAPSSQRSSPSMSSAHLRLMGGDGAGTEQPH